MNFISSSSNGRDVLVGSNLSIGEVVAVLESHIFQNWVKSLDPEICLERIIIQTVDFKKNGKEVLFIRLKVKLANSSFEQIVELRGGVSVMLPVLICENEKYVILVKQLRLPIGKAQFAELSAGMIDNDSFLGAAVREIEEELGIVIKKDELINMTQILLGGLEKEIYSSPGLLDEKAQFFLLEREVTQSELEKFQGKATGVAEEGERITLQIVKLEDVLLYTRDMKTMVALYLYGLFQ